MFNLIKKVWNVRYVFTWFMSCLAQPFEFVSRWQTQMPHLVPQGHFYLICSSMPQQSTFNHLILPRREEGKNQNCGKMLLIRQQSKAGGQQLLRGRYSKDKWNWVGIPRTGVPAGCNTGTGIVYPSTGNLGYHSRSMKYGETTVIILCHHQSSPVKVSPSIAPNLPILCNLPRFKKMYIMLYFKKEEQNWELTSGG